MQFFKKIWHGVANHHRTHIVLRFIFDCTSYADISARSVAIRLSLIVTAMTLLFIAFAVLFNWKIDWSYREGFPMTRLSVFFLFVIGHFCLKIREECGNDVAIATFWKILGISFIFLAFDDWLRIHETTDRLIHSIFRIHETEWTDHLDDVLVAVYAMVIAMIIFRGRHMLLQFTAALPFFVPAAILSAAHCLLDFVVSARSWIRGFVPDPVALENTIVWAEIAEESCKIGAEIFIIATAVRCYEIARDRRRASIA